MQTRNDLEFYARRERQERVLADGTSHPAGRRVHLELARRYARLIEEAQPGPTMRMTVPGA